MRLNFQIHLTLPVWLREAIDPGAGYRSDEAKVELAIALARGNAGRGGGPFGAAIFDGLDRLVAVGVNQVVPQSCSVAHAEMMALMTAQQRCQRFRLNDPDGGLPAPVALATSAQPCCQCYGAGIWAGIDALLIGARGEDVEALTEFDEGPLPADWIGELDKRGITVRRDIRREEACEVLRAYTAAGGARY